MWLQGQQIDADATPPIVMPLSRHHLTFHYWCRLAYWSSLSCHYYHWFAAFISFFFTSSSSHAFFSSFATTPMLIRFLRCRFAAIDILRFDMLDMIRDRCHYADAVDTSSYAMAIDVAMAYATLDMSFHYCHFSTASRFMSRCRFRHWHFNIFTPCHFIRYALFFTCHVITLISAFSAADVFICHWCHAASRWYFAMLTLVYRYTPLLINIIPRSSLLLFITTITVFFH